MMRFFQKGKRSPAGSIFVGYQYTPPQKVMGIVTGLFAP